MTSPSPTLDARRIVPRLKTPAFLRAVEAIPVEQRPLSRPWLGPLHVAYALDEGDAYRFVNAQMAHDAGLTPDALHALALRNLPAAGGTSSCRPRARACRSMACMPTPRTAPACASGCCRWCRSST
jgi:hypothetical protein